MPKIVRFHETGTAEGLKFAKRGHKKGTDLFFIP